MRRLEKELLHIKEKVRRSKLSYWEKRQAYEMIVKLGRMLDLEED